MTNNNGYVVVDCGGLNLLADSSQTITGLYNRCKDAINSNKPIIASNCNYGANTPVTPINVFAITEGTTFIFTASILQIRVASTDVVTIVPLVE